MRLQTERLILRPFRDDDLDLYAALNADPRVMEHFPSVLTREQSAAEIVRIRETTGGGLGFLAVEIPGQTTCAGFIGLNRPGWPAPFQPCVEIGWRLATAYWGHGYATEGARACLAHGFGALGLEEIVAFTAVGNTRSRAVMARLGMTYDRADDFDHPRIAEGHPLRRHVLYRVRPT
jgi:RimJ/RimL family protein N-acetyltransferase